MRCNLLIVVLPRFIQAAVKLPQLPWLIFLEMKLWVGFSRYPTDEKCTRWLVDHTIGILKKAGNEPRNGFEVRCLQVMEVVVETLIKIPPLVTLWLVIHISILAMCGVVPVPA